LQGEGELRHEPPFLLVRQAGKLEAHRLGEALKALLELLGEGPVPLQVEDGHHLPPLPEGKGELGEGLVVRGGDVVRVPAHVRHVHGPPLPVGPAHHAPVGDGLHGEGGAGGEEAEALPLGHPHPHVPPLPEAGEALGEAFQEFFPVLGLGEGLQGLGEEPVGLGQVLGPAVGPAEAFPHLVRKKGGEEEGGEGGGVHGPLEEEEEACEAQGGKPRPEPEDARHEAHGHHEPGDGGALPKPRKRRSQGEGGQGDVEGPVHCCAPCYHGLGLESRGGAVVQKV